MWTRIKSFLQKVKLEHFLIIVLLEISAVAHGYNMFNFPYYENDEGTYMSQAWSVVTKGELAPYTYWYDHAPAGWFLISLWTTLTGGFFTFGMSVNSGRVLMLVLHVISTLLLYLITKKVSGSKLAATIAVLLFSLSPLAIYFHRRVLLDNIMTFWVLLSFYVLVRKRPTLWSVVSSAILMAIAVLSKESAIFFAPGIVVYLVLELRKEHRIFSVLQWLFVFGSVVSTYMLYALLKGEFFPYGTRFGGNAPHVSLLDSLKFQASRSNGSPIWDIQNNQFIHEATNWFLQDRLLIAASAIAFLGMIVISFRKKQYAPFVVATAFYLLYLARGGNVIEFYVLPPIPLFGLLVGAFVFEAFDSVRYGLSKIIRSPHVVKFSYSAMASLVLAFLAAYYAQYGHMNRGHNIYASNQTKAQIDAVEWIRKNISPDTVFVFDNYAHIDLKSANNPSGIVFHNAHWYLKVDSDPEVRYDVLEDKPENIAFFAMTPQAFHDVGHNKLDFMKRALEKTDKVKVFWNNGWGVEFLESRNPQSVVQRSWESYKQAFITKEGRTIDLEQSYSTTSEAQAYSMLRAVWLNDKETYDSLWRWSKGNLQKENKLFASLWKEEQNGKWGIGRKDSYLGADTDIALSLALASRQWNDPAYLSASQEIVQSLRNNSVKKIGTTIYLVSSDAYTRDTDALIHLAALSPYAYRVFSDIDKDFNWNSMIDNTYTIYDRCSSLSSQYISPDWCSISARGGTTFKSIDSPSDLSRSTAIHIPLKVSLDYAMSQDSRSKVYLEKMSFYKEEYKRIGKVVMNYGLDGTPKTTWESSAGYASVIGAFSHTDKAFAQDLYLQKIQPQYYHTDASFSYWENPENLYVQNWVWFGTALYGDTIPNIWSRSSLAAK